MVGGLDGEMSLHRSNVTRNHRWLRVLNIHDRSLKLGKVGLYIGLPTAEIRQLRGLHVHLLHHCDDGAAVRGNGGLELSCILAHGV